MEMATLKAKRRKVLGTRVSRAERAAGLLPAIIYGHKEAPEPVTLERHDVEVALAHHNRMVEVRIGKKTEQCLIKEVQYDHLDHEPIHLDFARVDLDERVRVSIGIELRGIPKGVSDGGLLDQYMANIEVECLATDIPETLHPIVADLGVGDFLLVKDLPLPEGVTALADPERRVATVRELSTLPEEPEAEAAEVEKAEPEMIGRSAKEQKEQSEKEKKE